jgi:hypothetical protein
VGHAPTRQIEDYGSGELVRDTAEERVTQLVSRWLGADMGYDKAQVRARPQWRVPKSPGSARSAGWPCDLVVFESLDAYEQPERIRAIIEVKAPEAHEGGRGRARRARADAVPPERAWSDPRRFDERR